MQNRLWFLNKWETIKVGKSYVYLGLRPDLRVGRSSIYACADENGRAGSRIPALGYWVTWPTSARPLEMYSSASSRVTGRAFPLRQSGCEEDKQRTNARVWAPGVKDCFTDLHVRGHWVAMWPRDQKSISCGKQLPQIAQRYCYYSHFKLYHCLNKKSYSLHTQSCH